MFIGGAVMRRRRALYFGAAVLALLSLCSPSGSSAEVQTNGGAAGLSSETRPSGGAWLDPDAVEVLVSDGIFLLLGVLGCGLIAVGMEAFDLWRERRAGEVALLRTRIATALQRDRLLKDLDVTPIVHLPLRGRSGATVELRGQVPTHGLRYAVLRTAELEAAKNMAVYHIDDRLVIAGGLGGVRPRCHAVR